MSHYILIHGVWKESKIWDDVSPVLLQNGHEVTAIDMPGHGANLQPISDVTLARYVQDVADAIILSTRFTPRWIFDQVVKSMQAGKSLGETDGRVGKSSTVKAA